MYFRNYAYSSITQRIKYPHTDLHTAVNKQHSKHKLNFPLHCKPIIQCLNNNFKDAGQLLFQILMLNELTIL